MTRCDHRWERQPRRAAPGSTSRAPRVGSRPSTTRSSTDEQRRRDPPDERRRPSGGVGAAPRVAGMGRRPALPGALRLEAPPQPIWTLAGVGRARRRPSRRVPGTAAMGVRAWDVHPSRGETGRHRDAPRIPGARHLHAAHTPRARRAPDRRRRARVQHAERPEPPRVPEDGMEVDRSCPGDRPSDPAAEGPPYGEGARTRRALDHREPGRRAGRPRARRRAGDPGARRPTRDEHAAPDPLVARVPALALRGPPPRLPPRSRLPADPRPVSRCSGSAGGARRGKPPSRRCSSPTATAGRAASSCERS